MTNTISTYAIPRDVVNLIMSEQLFDANSSVPAGMVESALLAAESEFEERTGQAYKPVLHTEELWDLEAHIARYPDIFQLTFGRWGIKLHHQNIIPFSSTRGHKIEIYRGSEPWEDYVADKTEGRNRDYWVDHAKGIVWIRKPFAMYMNSAVRVTYEAGKLPTQLNGAMAIDAATITVDDTKGYQTRGVIRIGYEYISYTGKTTTTFTGCTRAQLNTEAEAHADDSEVVQVPDNIRTLIAKRAAIQLLQSEKFIAFLPEGAGAEYGLDKQIADWQKDWEEAIGGTYQKWDVF